MSVLERAPDDRFQMLTPEGELREGAPEPDLDDATLVEMYRELRLGRRFDERAVSLQRQGRMGTYPPLSGQEGSQVGSAHALDAEDWIFPSYREHLAAHVRGMPLKRTLLYWMGDERGNRIPEDVNMFPVAVPIGTQIPHATGAAWASKLQGEGRAFLAYFGDGATSEGDFHEGLNFGGVFDVPCVYFCNNNQWAISVPRERQTAAGTLAEKARAYGFEGVQVDGMDPLAVHRATREAVEKAKEPGGRRRPTLIEAVQYRFGAHTTADDPSAYRDEAEVETWKRRDPLPRMEAFLRDRGLLDDERIEAIEAEVEGIVADAVEAAEGETRPHPDDIFEHVHAEPTWHQTEQREWFARFRERHGDGAILEE